MVVPSGSAATIRPSSAVAGPAAVSNRSRTPRRYPPRPGDVSASAYAIRCNRRLAEAIDHELCAGIADVDDERPAIGHPAQPGLERIGHRAAVREHVRVIPLRPGQDRDLGR